MSDTLASKSIHDLRAIAQGYGIPDIFAKTDVQLRQAIELKQQKMVPDAPVVIPKPEYDARLMTAEPSAMGDRAEIEALLSTHVARGLHLSFDEEHWHMSHGDRSDSGTLRMQLRTVLRCADRVLHK